MADRAADDSAIIPLLHRITRVTFFTHDRDFWRADLCHPTYCLVFLETRFQDAARFVRAFLRHGDFDTNTKRLGKVVRVHPDGLMHYDSRHSKPKRTAWLRAV